MRVRAYAVPALVLVVTASNGRSFASESPRPALPRPAADVIFEAARSHPLVALSEGQHWNEQGHRFRLDLLRDPRFAATFDDIVVESGNSLYQPLMDRFTAGDDVPQESIRQAWENTTQPNEVWDLPIYEEFFRAVRAANAARPASKRLRVILGDPPIDWSTVKSTADVLHWMGMRDRFAADLIRAEVLDKKRRGLLVFGDGHLWRTGPQARPDLAPERSVTSFLAQSAPGLVFIIGAPTGADLKPIQADTANWPAPSIALLKGTVLGAAPFAPLYRTPFQDMRAENWGSLRLEDQLDALLYLGPPETITLASLPPQRCAEPRYMAMRLARLALVPWGQGQIERLKQICAPAARPR